MKDSKLSRALTWAIDLVAAGLLWCLCSLPVVTIGAANAALYYTVVKCVRHGRGSLRRVFWDGLRSNLKGGTKMWLLYLAATAAGAANVTAARQLGGGGFSPLTALAGVIFLPVLLTLPWMFACLSRFENTLAGSLRFVGFLAVSHPGRSLLLAAELLSALLIAWLIPWLIPLLPGAYALLMSLVIEPVFRQYTGGASSADAWYNE